VTVHDALTIAPVLSQPPIQLRKLQHLRHRVARNRPRRRRRQHARGMTQSGHSADRIGTSHANRRHALNGQKAEIHGPSVSALTLCPPENRRESLVSAARATLNGMSAEGQPQLRLPPTSPDLLRDETRPYFLWWLDSTVGDLKQALADPD